MIDLVFWSCVLGFSPIALCGVWRLIAVAAATLNAAVAGDQASCCFRGDSEMIVCHSMTSDRH